METIIHQIVTGAVKRFLEYFEVHGVSALSRMTEDLKCLSDEMVKELLLAFIDESDEAICAAKRERKKDGVKIHERRVSRTLFTALGELTYERTYFNTEAGRSYLLDDVLEVEPYERIDSGVSARLVNSAAMYSYFRGAAIVTGGLISRQSVRNKVMNTGEVLYIPEKTTPPPEALHIFADEAHVSLQSGKRAIVPLVTVCAGKQRKSENRNELLEPFYIQGYGMKPETHWQYVYALCAEKYDMECVKKIYIYGDGAAWIKRSIDVFPGAVQILDDFHFKKRLRSLLAGEICSSFSLVIRNQIRENDRSAFKRTLQKILVAIGEKVPEGIERLKKTKSVQEHGVYILAHWDAIQNMQLPDSIGSCTEAIISHALAERFSRNPMGWSKEGLSKMAMIRTFVLNGGIIQPADIIAWKHRDKRISVTTKLEKYEQLIKEQHDKIFKDSKNWRWFETDNLVSGKLTGTKIALDALGRIRNVS